MPPQPFLGSTSGLTPQRLRARRYRHLSRDLYVVRGELTEREELLVRVRAAVLAMPGAVPCRQTAALLVRLPVDDDGLVHLARGRGAAWSARPGVAVHRLVVAPDERLLVQGLEVTDGPRTFVDLAADLPLEDLVAVGDVVLRRYGRAPLLAAVAAAEGRSGVRLARTAVALSDAGADSPAETRARLRLHAAGFLGLQHGVVVTDSAGGWLAAPDLADPVARVAVQHDGLVHLQGDPDQRRADVMRDELSRQSDWQVVVATARDDRQPHLLIDRVADAYRRNARYLGPGVLPPFLRSATS